MKTAVGVILALGLAIPAAAQKPWPQEPPLLFSTTGANLSVTFGNRGRRHARGLALREESFTIYADQQSGT